MARSASTTAYAATVAEIAAFANGAYAPNYAVANPTMDGAAAPGVATTVSRGDHVHPSDTARVAKAGDTMAGFLTLNANPTSNLHAATKQYVDGSAPVGGPYVSIANMHDVGRNYIHNPLFAVAQRGVGPWTTTGVYTADRWQSNISLDAASFRVDPSLDAMRTGVGDEGVDNVLSNTFTGNAGAGSYTFLAQKIENVRRLAGKTVTVSFYGAASVALKLGVSMGQTFGTGGSPSAGVNLNGQSVQLTTAWGPRYSVTFTLPSIVGKTLGTDTNSSYTTLNLWYSSGTGTAALAGSIGVQAGVITLWGVQLEVGSVATPLEKPDPQQDLAKCQRFYMTGFVSMYAYNVAGAYMTQIISLPVPMRVNPTIVPTLTPSNVTGSTMDAQTTYQLRVVGTATATGAANVIGSFTASADL